MVKSLTGRRDLRLRVSSRENHRKPLASVKPNVAAGSCPPVQVGGTDGSVRCLRDIPIGPVRSSGINRVEPRESNSRPVFGRVFNLTPHRHFVTPPPFSFGKWGRTGGGRRSHDYPHSSATRRLVAASPGSRTSIEAATNYQPKKGSENVTTSTRKI